MLLLPLLLLLSAMALSVMGEQPICDYCEDARSFTSLESMMAYRTSMNATNSQGRPSSYKPILNAEQVRRVRHTTTATPAQRHLAQSDSDGDADGFEQQICGVAGESCDPGDTCCYGFAGGDGGLCYVGAAVCCHTNPASACVYLCCVSSTNVAVADCCAPDSQCCGGVTQQCAPADADCCGNDGGYCPPKVSGCTSDDTCTTCGFPGGSCSAAPTKPSNDGSATIGSGTGTSSGGAGGGAGGYIGISSLPLELGFGIGVPAVIISAIVITLVCIRQQRRASILRLQRQNFRMSTAVMPIHPQQQHHIIAAQGPSADVVLVHQQNMLGAPTPQQLQGYCNSQPPQPPPVLGVPVASPQKPAPPPAYNPLQAQPIPPQQVMPIPPQQVMPVPPQQVMPVPPQQVMPVPPQQVMPVPPQQVMPVPPQQVMPVPPQQSPLPVYIPPQQQVAPPSAQPLPVYVPPQGVYPPN